jgi:hypothetical protein
MFKPSFEHIQRSFSDVIHFVADGYLTISNLVESVSIQTLPLPKKLKPV